MKLKMNILGLLLILSLGLFGCSSTGDNTDMETEEQQIAEADTTEELENINKLTKEVITYMTNIKNGYNERLEQSNEDAKKYIDNVYRGPAISEKKEKIDSIHTTTDETNELKSKLSGTWIHFTNILSELSKDDSNNNSIDRSIESITNNIQFIEDELKK